MKSQVDLVHAQLFLDDAAIEEHHFVSRQWHSPRKLPQPVLRGDLPWERWAPVLYGTVLHWRGRFRMWYCCWTRHRSRLACYAESTDGAAWEKPRLGLFEYDGSKDNNIILMTGDPHGVIDDLTVIDDPDDSQWPLKMLFWEGKSPKGNRPGIHAARSRDGIHWDRSLGLVLPDWGDRFNAASEKCGGRYLLLGRAPQQTRSGREVWRTTSADLRRWSPPERVLARDLQDPPDREYYSATAFAYEGLLLGSLERMGMSPDKLDTELIWSRDLGRTWQRAPTRPAFLAPSPERAWDDTWVNLPTNGPLRQHGHLWFYYSGRSSAHGSVYPLNQGGVGLAILRVDGFASLCSAQRFGHVVTRPMRWPDADLHINADPRRDLTAHPRFCCGEVRVEVRDAVNRPCKGFSWDECIPLTENTVNDPDACRRVLWKGNRSLRGLAGRVVRLAFRLRDAHLFSFRARADRG